MFKNLLIVTMISFAVVALLTLGSPVVAKADARDNASKGATGVLAGWTEVVIYPVQEAAKPGWLGKAMLPANIVLGAIKGAVREVAGAGDFLTFWKDQNIVDSWPGEAL